MIDSIARRYCISPEAAEGMEVRYLRGLFTVLAATCAKCGTVHRGACKSGGK